MKRLALFLLLIAYYELLYAESLPVVYIVAQNLSPEFSDGTIKIDDGEEMPAEIRYRGASALQYKKKSFAIKLKDNDGNKLDVPLLGMRSDNSWILDAMAVDKARMRNRVSTDLWLDFSAKLHYADDEPQAVNGTHGKFVEVFLNDEYYGLFCMTEKIDRKQLKLKKISDNSVRGVLYKLIGYFSMWIQDSSRYEWNNLSDKWNNAWEAKYPDLSQGESIDWEPLVNIVRWLNDATDEEVKNGIAETIDLPVWIDYFLLTDLLLADDNVAKNMFVSFYNIQKPNCRATVTPWDLDATWGRNYKAETMDPYAETAMYHQIHSRLLFALNGATTLYEPRYAALRQHYFTADVLKNYFKRYFNLFRSTEAAQREQARWDGVDGIELDFDAEEEYIYNWIDQRLTYLDEKYNYAGTSDLVILPEETTDAGIYPVYSVYGDIVGHVAVPDYVSVSSLGLNRGVYVVQNKKYLIR